MSTRCRKREEKKKKKKKDKYTNEHKNVIEKMNGIQKISKLTRNEETSHKWIGK